MSQRRALVAVVGLAVALAGCVSHASNIVAQSGSPRASPVPSTSPSPSPAPSPSGCLDRPKALAAADAFRSAYVAAVTDQALGSTQAEAVELKRAKADVRTLIILVSADPGLEGQARALLADVILGSERDPKREQQESDAFDRIPTDYGELLTAIQEDNSDPAC